MKDNDWLKNLTTGDKVTVVDSTGLKRVVMVTRVTATQIVIGDDRFSKKTGLKIGGVITPMQTRYHLEEWNQAVEDEKERRYQEDLAKLTLDCDE